MFLAETTMKTVTKRKSETMAQWALLSEWDGKVYCQKVDHLIVSADSRSLRSDCSEREWKLNVLRMVICNSVGCIIECKVLGMVIWNSDGCIIESHWPCVPIPHILQCGNTTIAHSIQPHTQENVRTGQLQTAYKHTHMTVWEHANYKDNTAHTHYSVRIRQLQTVYNPTHMTVWEHNNSKQ